MIRNAASASIAYTASIRNEPTPALIWKASMLFGTALLPSVVTRAQDDRDNARAEDHEVAASGVL